MGKVFVTKPYLPPIEDFYEYLEDIWNSRCLTNNGKYHQLFEEKLCEYLGVNYISLFSNGTLALITALQALELTGEVITSPYSFVATTNALWWNKIQPVFVDIEANTFNIDPTKIEAAITPNTEAILPIHVYGNPCDVHAINKIAESYNLKVIYDACHTFGVNLFGTPILNFGNLSVISFHATKSFNTFEGGAIICHDAEMKNRIDILKNHGIQSETSVIYPGLNAKMNEFQAALGIVQLKYIDNVISRRKQITSLYRDELRILKGIYFLNDFQDVTHCYSYFPVLIDPFEYGIDRDQLFEKLKSHQVYCRKYFYPLISQFPAFKDLSSAKNENLPVASDVSNRVLCLPLYPDLETDDVKKIVQIIKEV